MFSPLLQEHTFDPSVPLIKYRSPILAKLINLPKDPQGIVLDYLTPSIQNDNVTFNDGSDFNIKYASDYRIELCINDIIINMFPSAGGKLMVCIDFKTITLDMYELPSLNYRWKFRFTDHCIELESQYGGLVCDLETEKIILLRRPVTAWECKN